jgi:GTPase SAR1 family protein
VCVCVSHASILCVCVLLSPGTAQGLEYLETSAKEAINVSKAFESLAETVIEHMPDEEMSYETVDLSQKAVAKKDEGCNC